MAASTASVSARLVFGSKDAGVGLTDIATANDKEAGQTVTTGADTAFPLGGITTPGLIWCRNLDGTNAIDIKAAVAGDILVRLNAGDIALFRFRSGVTAPSHVAVAGTPLLEFQIVDA